jgi:hypothetical protein
MLMQVSLRICLGALGKTLKCVNTDVRALAEVESVVTHHGVALWWCSTPA